MPRGYRKPLQDDAERDSVAGLFSRVRASRPESSTEQLAAFVREMSERQDTLNKDVVRILSEIRVELEHLERVTIELDRELTRVTRDLGEVSVRVTAALSAGQEMQRCSRREGAGSDAGQGDSAELQSE